MGRSNLALEILAKLDALDQERILFRRMYGDDRGAKYDGNMEADLLALAKAVVKESIHE